MSRLAIAGDAQIDLISRESHALWGGGLSHEAYRDFWRDLSATRWAREHFDFHVWLDARDEVLSSCKLYRPRVRCLGREGPATVIGAVFTRPAHRRRGHALDMLRAELGRARDRGDMLSLLFSDIGTGFYGALGYRALPAEETWGRLPRGSAASEDGWTLEPFREADLDPVVGMHADWSRRRPLAVLRDRDHWEFLLARAWGFFRRLGHPTLKPAFRVARRRGSTLGYVIGVHGPAEWSVREVGAIDGDADTMAQVLRLGAAEARSLGMRKLYGWLPRSITDRLDWRLRRGPRTRAIPMILPLRSCPDLAPLEDPDAAFLPYQDQF